MLIIAAGGQSMQYHLETIPVWEAMEQRGECPLCALHGKTERDVLERTLGDSVMEPSERIRVNRTGFCGAHQKQLYGMGNRLGHALLMDTHGQQRLAQVRALAGKASQAASGWRFWGRKGAGLPETARELAALAEGCVVCETVEMHMARYRHTFLHLYKHDGAFRAAWEASHGLCLPHLAELLALAATDLPETRRAAFAAEGLSKLARLLEADGDDLRWFTSKFDYRNQDKPWGDSKTALKRMANRLRGQCIDDTPTGGSKTE